jgi:hypothetical protein
MNPAMVSSIWLLASERQRRDVQDDQEESRLPTIWKRYLAAAGSRSLVPQTDSRAPHGRGEEVFQVSSSPSIVSTTPIN